MSKIRVRVTVVLGGLDGVLAALDELGSDQESAHRKYHQQYFLPRQRARYALAHTTPYAHASLGTIKPFSKTIRGSFGLGSQFAEDSGNMRRDMTTEDGLSVGATWSELGSERHYTPLVDEILQAKGPLKGRGIATATDEDGAMLGEFLYRKIEMEWNQ